ncbi:hypothetical protein WJX73_008861 [Symbiochloris irregularis]|uniref:Uncharacterized protein n=1 Tax=Symbiochloris irregularis TaxID=706552 RepID=A0AAW1NKM9_9CHLO
MNVSAIEADVHTLLRAFAEAVLHHGAPVCFATLRSVWQRLNFSFVLYQADRERFTDPCAHDHAGAIFALFALYYAQPEQNGMQGITLAPLSTMQSAPRSTDPSSIPDQPATDQQPNGVTCTADAGVSVAVASKAAGSSHQAKTGPTADALAQQQGMSAEMSMPGAAIPAAKSASAAEPSGEGGMAGKTRDARVRIYTPLSLLRHIIACISDDSSLADSFPAGLRVEMRTCVRKLLQDNAFVIGAVRKPVKWKVTRKKKEDTADAELPWLERLKMTSQQAAGAPSHRSQVQLSAAGLKVLTHLTFAMDSTRIRANVQLLLDSYRSKHASLASLTPAGMSHPEILLDPGMANHIDRAAQRIGREVNTVLEANRRQKTGRKRKSQEPPEMQAADLAVPPEEDIFTTTPLPLPGDASQNGDTAHAQDTARGNARARKRGRGSSDDPGVQGGRGGVSRDVATGLRGYAKIVMELTRRQDEERARRSDDEDLDDLNDVYQDY